MMKKIINILPVLLLLAPLSLGAAAANKDTKRLAPQRDTRPVPPRPGCCSRFIDACWKKICCSCCFKTDEDVLFIAAFRVPRSQLQALIEKVTAIERDDQDRFFAVAYAINQPDYSIQAKNAALKNFFLELETTLDENVFNAVLPRIIQPAIAVGAGRSAYDDGTSEDKAAYRTLSIEDLEENLADEHAKTTE